MSLTIFRVLAGHGQQIGETVLHHFDPASNDGGSPYSGVIEGGDGMLYGTTWGGGTNAAGTVFRMSRDGASYTILHHFGSTADGSTPFASLVQANDGFLYGTTFYGGTNANGTIFKINTNGQNYSVLYRFTNSPDGANPYAGLIQGTDGMLYGTAQTGGYNLGTVFKINPNGTGYATLHTFTNFGGDGMVPFGGLVQTTNGLLYGTTSQGGSGILGTVYALNTNGSGYTIVHNFTGFPDGASPEAGLLVGTDGWLYGTTVIGGSNGYGNIFKLNTSGTSFTNLYSFTNSPDGANSYASLAQGADGALYGTTVNGGVTNSGTIFRLRTDGTGYSVLYSFTDANGDGSAPFAGMISSNGVFFGTTLQGGAHGFGTVFRFALQPFIAIVVPGAGVPHLTLTGMSGQSCQLQARSNPVNWDPLTALAPTNGSAEYNDSSAPSHATRFYRALIQ